MSIPADLINLFSEDETPPKKIIDRSIRSITKKVTQMMKDRRGLKEVMGFLDKAVVEMDEEIENAKIMMKAADMAVKFQFGGEITEEGTGCKVQDNRKHPSASAIKAHGSQSDNGESSSNSPAAESSGEE